MTLLLYNWIRFPNQGICKYLFYSMACCQDKALGGEGGRSQIGIWTQGSGLQIHLSVASCCLFCLSASPRLNVSLGGIYPFCWAPSVCYRSSSVLPRPTFLTSFVSDFPATRTPLRVEIHGQAKSLYSGHGLCPLRQSQVHGQFPFWPFLLLLLNLFPCWDASEGNTGCEAHSPQMQEKPLS